MAAGAFDGGTTPLAETGVGHLNFGTNTLFVEGVAGSAAVSTFDIGSTGLIVGTEGHLNVLTTTLFLDAVAVTA